MSINFVICKRVLNGGKIAKEAEKLGKRRTEKRPPINRYKSGFSSPSFPNLSPNSKSRPAQMLILFGDLEGENLAPVGAVTREIRALIRISLRGVEQRMTARKVVEKKQILVKENQTKVISH